MPENKDTFLPSLRGRSQWLLAGLLFLSLYGVYWSSVPGEFNTVVENRVFFDSDGEFIVRQFRAGKTFTHNDHLLYHVLAKAIYRLGNVPGIGRDPVRIHKFLSVSFGALGISALYLFGYFLTRRHGLALLCALFIGGSAGWWFFSATIDTYIPCLFASIVALGLAMMALEKQHWIYFALSGLFAGIAFLFRTDSALLFVLGIILITSGRDFPKRAAVMAVAVVFSGVLAYSWLAHAIYHVPWQDVPAWAAGSLQRPEARSENMWGSIHNLQWEHAKLTLVNHLFYTIFLPGLEATRVSRLHEAYTAPAGILLASYAGLLGWCVYSMVRKTFSSFRQRHYQPLFLLALALLWFIPRIVLYTWWNPYDPFLFAVMNTPAIWLVLLSGTAVINEQSRRPSTRVLCNAGLAVITLTVWIHNAGMMTGPLRELPRAVSGPTTTWERQPAIPAQKAVRSIPPDYPSIAPTVYLVRCTTFQVLAPLRSRGKTPPAVFSPVRPPDMINCPHPGGL